MLKFVFLLAVLIGIFAVYSCSKKNIKKNTFGYDVHFLKKHVNVELLKVGKSQIAVVGDYQARIMTSTSKGMKGKSYGFLKYDNIAAPINENLPINVFGGEDRFWMGPEGGQFSIFFKQGDPMDFKHWKTPKEIDTEPFELLEKTDKSLTYKKQISLKNYSGYEFKIEVKRKVHIFNEAEIKKNLELTSLKNVSFVGFESENTIKNIGSEKWQKNKGLLSIWILGMFPHSKKTSVMIPYQGDLNLNTSYFGAISSDRLKITEKAIFFKGDGDYRSKIGVLPENALPVLGSYDAENHILTIVKYSFDTKNKDYVNSLWQPHLENPYGGDVINSYNDGPLENGSYLGPFYELETSSYVQELDAGESLKHTHQTYHFEGDFKSLNMISQKILDINLKKIPF